MTALEVLCLFRREPQLQAAPINVAQIIVANLERIDKLRHRTRHVPRTDCFVIDSLHFIENS